MSSQPGTGSHPALAFAHAAQARLDALTSATTWSMTPAEQLETLQTLAVVTNQVAALQLRVLAEADRSEAPTVVSHDTGDDHETGAAVGSVGASAVSVADWVAVTTRQVRRHARADLHLARALEKHPHLAGACDRGLLNLPQARAVLTALDRLPTDGTFAVTADQRQQAEEHLVGLASHHDAADLAVLGRKIFEVVAPDLAEAFEGRVLEQQEARALRRTTLTLREDDEGTCHGRFRIPSLHGQMLTKMIQALASPTRPTGQDPGDQDRTGMPGRGIDPDLPTPVRHGIALTQLVESLAAEDLPRTGGVGATVVVTMTLDQLLARLHDAGACTLDTGAVVSAAEARRLACTAGIIPVVLGGASQVLDVGRRRRFHTEAQRIAMGVRDGGCTARGCDAPPGWCHAHHYTPLSQGGPTSTDNGRLLCGHHHRRLHDPTWRTTHHPDGSISFHRRE